MPNLLPAAILRTFLLFFTQLAAFAFTFLSFWWSHLLYPVVWLKIEHIHQKHHANFTLLLSGSLLPSNVLRQWQFIAVFSEFFLRPVSAFPDTFNYSVVTSGFKFLLILTSFRSWCWCCAQPHIVTSGELGLCQYLHMLAHEASFEVQALFAILSLS